MHTVDTDNSDKRQGAQWEKETGIFEGTGQDEYSRPDVTFYEMDHRFYVPVLD